MHRHRTKLVKVSDHNRRRFMRICLFLSLASISTILTGGTTNRWLVTAQRLKYWDQNVTQNKLTKYTPPVFYKNATFGPWHHCWRNPANDWKCFSVRYFDNHDNAASDTTEAIEMSVRTSVYFLMISILLSATATITAGMSIFWNNNSYYAIFSCALLHIFTGLSTLLCLIIYMQSVTQEVGKKSTPESDLDEPLFYYQWGYSFWFVVVSFLSTEIAAIFALMVYMARHDEQMQGAIRIRAMCKTSSSDLVASLGSSRRVSPSAKFSKLPRHSIQLHLQPPPQYESRQNSHDISSANSIENEGSLISSMIMDDRYPRVHYLPAHHFDTDGHPIPHRYSGRNRGSMCIDVIDESTVRRCESDDTLISDLRESPTFHKNHFCEQLLQCNQNIINVGAVGASAILRQQIDTNPGSKPLSTTPC